MKSTREIGKLALTAGKQTLRAQSTSVSVPFETAKPYDDIPSPRGWPVLKNLMQFLKKEHQKNFTDYHKTLIRDLGTIYRFRLPFKMDDMVFVTKPEDVRTLHANDGSYPHQIGFEVFNNIRKGALKDKYGTSGLFTNGKAWLETRQLVQQDMMRPKSATFYIKDISEVVDELMVKMEKNLNTKREVSELTNILQGFALEAVGIMFIGSKLGTMQGSKEGEKLINAVQRVFELTFIMVSIPERVAKYLPQYKEFVECNAVMFDICKAKIDQAIAKDKLVGSLEGTVLKKLINRCEKDSPIPVVMAADALAAGIDTTGNSAAFLLYHLASHPEKQEKLYQEIIKFAGKDGELTEKALAEMRYLKACQTESQRLAPIVIATARKTNVPMVLDGYQIPEGTTVFRHATILNGRDDFFQNADKFVPERWIRGTSDYEKRDSYAYLPFGHGSRACIGQRFARMELYVLMFKLIQKYKLSYEGPPIKINHIGIGHPDQELKLKMVRR